MSTYTWIALLAYATIGSFLGMMAALMWPRVTVPHYNPGMNYAGAYLALGGLIVGCLLGLITGLLPSRPGVVLILLELSAFGILIYLSEVRVRQLNRELITAVRTGNLLEVQRLQNEEANRNTRDSAGKTPLQIALDLRDREMVALLISIYPYPPKIRPTDRARILALCGENRLIIHILDEPDRKKRHIIVRRPL